MSFGRRAGIERPLLWAVVNPMHVSCFDQDFPFQINQGMPSSNVHWRYKLLLKNSDGEILSAYGISRPASRTSSMYVIYLTGSIKAGFV